MRNDHHFTLASIPALLAALVGCAAVEPPHSAASDAPDALLIVVSVHQGAPAPDLPSVVDGVLRAAVEARAPINVIALDGSPEIVSRIEDYPLTDANPAAHEADVLHVMDTTLKAVRSAEADDDGADLSGALFRAADAIAAYGASSPAVVVIGSGLSDRGLPAMTDPGMTLADPAEVADAAADNGWLPQLGTATAYLVGFGYTAAPQPELTEPQRQNIVAIWRAVLEASGAEVVSLPAPRPGEGPSTEHTTGIVEPATVPDLSSVTAGEFVFGDGSVLAFEPRSDVFRDEPAARAALRGIAQWLTERPGRRATVVGTTARWGGDDEQLRVSHDRAQRVRAELLAAGVLPEQIQAEGVGSFGPTYRDDRRPDGTLDEGVAALNRTTIITLVEAR